MLSGGQPLLVVEGPRRAAAARVSAAVDVVSAAGWTVVRGWAAPLARDRIVCTGRIRNIDDARRALLAAVSGAGLLVSSAADPETADRLVDDLQRLGPVERLTVSAPVRKIR